MGEVWSVMWLPAVACLVLVTIHAYLGIHILARGVIFVDLSLAQIAALGSTTAVLLGYHLDSGMAYALGVSFTLAGAFIMSMTRIRHPGVPQEAIIGVTWAVASSAAILMVSSAPHGAEHIEALLVGSILWVAPQAVLQAALAYAAIGLFHWIFRHRFARISFDHAGAERDGMRVRLWDFLFYATLGIVVTISVRMAGVLLVFSFLIVPGIIGVLFARRIGARLLIGWTAGWLVSIAGALASYHGDLPTGATVVCTFGAALLVALALYKLRSHRRAP